MLYITKSNTRLILIKNLCLSTYIINYLMVGVKKRNLDQSVEALVINTASVKTLAKSALRYVYMRKAVQGYITCAVIRK